jgi:hypothetical protein
VKINYLKASQINNELMSNSPINSTEKNWVMVLKWEKNITVKFKVNIYIYIYIERERERERDVIRYS